MSYGKVQWKENSEATKRKISDSLKNKKKSDEHKRAISEGMKKYWETIPYEEEKNNGSDMR